MSTDNYYDSEVRGKEDINNENGHVPMIIVYADIQLPPRHGPHLITPIESTRELVVNDVASANTA